MPSITIFGVCHVYELTPPIDNSELPVLVFVHGWLLSRRYWQPLVKILQSHYRCLLYDLRGFGDSAAKHTTSSGKLKDPALNYSLKTYATDLDCLLEKLEIDRAWLIGHSLGGSIALWTAHLNPQRIEGVICVNAGGGIYLKEEFERFRNIGKQLVKFRPSWLRHCWLADWLFARMMVYHPLKVHWGRQRIADFLAADEEAALGALLESTTEAEVHLLPQLVSRLSQPVYFIAGDRDRVMELKYVHHLASFHELFTQNNSNVIEIADCGHLAMLEYGDRLATIIKEIVPKHQINRL
jgi:pimeloyl-ACP methyl ester carboxylesterase